MSNNSELLVVHIMYCTPSSQVTSMPTLIKSLMDFDPDCDKYKNYIRRGLSLPSPMPTNSELLAVHTMYCTPSSQVTPTLTFRKGSMDFDPEWIVVSIKNFYNRRGLSLPSPMPTNSELLVVHIMYCTPGS